MGGRDERRAWIGDARATGVGQKSEILAAPRRGEQCGQRPGIGSLRQRLDIDRGDRPWRIQ